jgi:hypothetical protein
MAKKQRVGVLEYNQVPGTEPEHHCGRAIADTLVRWHEARWIGKRRLIQMVRGGAEDAIKQAKAARDGAKVIIRKILTNGPLGIGNLLPFAKAHNYGDPLHYETPMAGDNDLLRRFGMYFDAQQNKYVTRTISISSRSLF